MLRRILVSSVILFASSSPALQGQSHLSGKNTKYVALGSSFGAGPGVAGRAPGRPALCMQSDSNYPHLLAARRGLHLVDVTCSGATTTDILSNSLYGSGPQIEAVDADTKLVTVTVGGNDISYLGNLWAESCQHAPGRVPAAWKPYICKITPTAAVNRAINDLPGNMKSVVTAIRSRSPHAEIIFVNYIDIFSEKSSCPARVPLSAEEIETARKLADTLREITARVAIEEHVKLISADALSKGHDVCSSDSWLFGYTFPATLHDYGPIAYHPTLTAMKTIAAEIDKNIP